jgi:beta-glucosidase
VGLLPAPKLEPTGELDGALVAQEVAVRSFVLARNDGLLPLRANELSSVAVLGIAAAETRAMGGGSAEVVPKHVVSLLDGLSKELGEKVRYAIGADARANLPKAGGEHWSGLKVTCRDAGGNENFTESLVSASVRWIGDIPTPDIASVTVEGVFTPQTAGEHTFSVRGTGPFRLEVGGEMVWQDTIWPDMSDPASFLFPPEARVVVALGTSPVVVRLVHDMIEGLPIPATSVHLGHMEPRPGDDELIEEAVATAASADVAIVVVGTTEHVESEGVDRADLTLPGRQNELVERVLAVNPRTVVVVNSGSPVLMPWADRAPALMLAWFPGQQGGAALASVLLGEQEPGGRLPTTWPLRSDQALQVEPENGILRYSEELAIGYRAGFEALFPFGHGLGYTQWEYSALAVSGRQVMLTLRNIGDRMGREVVQVYLSRDGQRWLGGFASVALEPGEGADVVIELPKRAFQRWSEGGWQVGDGDYDVHIGRSVADTRLTGVASITA